MYKKILAAGFLLLIIFALAMLNSGVTGYTVSDLTGEFPGLGIFLLLLFGFIGMLLVKTLHDKELEKEQKLQ